MTQIKVIKTDITKLKVDVIVTSAGPSLLCAGWYDTDHDSSNRLFEILNRLSIISRNTVNNTIHQKAGLQMNEECRRLKECKTGEAKITGGFFLPAEFVIHTVGPMYMGGKSNEAEKLYNSYWNSLQLAIEHNIKTIAFPNISTGFYKYPKKKAAVVVKSVIDDFLRKYPNLLETIYFVCMDKTNFRIYKKIYISGNNDISFFSSLKDLIRKLINK